MISIVGCDQGPEADAAKQLRAAILRAWPWAETDPAAAIYLIPNVQCHGEVPRDIDLVILASLPPERATFAPSVQAKLLNGGAVEADSMRVRSLCIVVEVKDHVPQDVRFSGAKVEVRYRGGVAGEQWHSTTQQSERQKYSLRNYLARHLPGGAVPHITNLIWLRNVTRDALPRCTHNILPATPTWTALLNTVVANASVWREKVGIALAATPPESTFSFVKTCDVLSHHLTPTSLDRRRMDQIVQYDSCRGLESWAVINLGIDEFYDYKIAAWSRPAGADSSPNADEITLARRSATRWLMIPCSRAIDTLVLHVSSRVSYLGRALHGVCVRCGDLVEWIKV